MKCARESTPKTWKSIGARCAIQGWKVEVALTNNESVNKLIKEGFEKQTKKLSKVEKC